MRVAYFAILLFTLAILCHIRLHTLPRKLTKHCTAHQVGQRAALGSLLRWLRLLLALAGSSALLLWTWLARLDQSLQGLNLDEIRNVLDSLESIHYLVNSGWFLFTSAICLLSVWMLGLRLYGRAYDDSRRIFKQLILLEEKVCNRISAAATSMEEALEHDSNTSGDVDASAVRKASAALRERAQGRLLEPISCASPEELDGPFGKVRVFLSSQGFHHGTDLVGRSLFLSGFLLIVPATVTLPNFSGEVSKRIVSAQDLQCSIFAKNWKLQEPDLPELPAADQDQVNNSISQLAYRFETRSQFTKLVQHRLPYDLKSHAVRRVILEMGALDRPQKVTVTPENPEAPSAFKSFRKAVGNQVATDEGRYVEETLSSLARKDASLRDYLKDFDFKTPISNEELRTRVVAKTISIFIGENPIYEETTRTVGSYKRFQRYSANSYIDSIVKQSQSRNKFDFDLAARTPPVGTSQEAKLHNIFRTAAEEVTLQPKRLPEDYYKVHTPGLENLEIANLPKSNNLKQLVSRPKPANLYDIVFPANPASEAKLAEVIVPTHGRTAPTASISLRETGLLGNALGSRSFRRMYFSPRVGGVLVGADPDEQNEKYPARDLTWETSESSVKLRCETATGRRELIVSREIAYYAMLYAADGRLVALTMTPLFEGAQERTVMTHPALEGSGRLQIALHNVDALVDSSIGIRLWEERTMADSYLALYQYAKWASATGSDAEQCAPILRKKAEAALHFIDEHPQLSAKGAKVLDKWGFPAPRRAVIDSFNPSASVDERLDHLKSQSESWYTGYSDDRCKSYLSVMESGVREKAYTLSETLLSPEEPRLRFTLHIVSSPESSDVEKESSLPFDREIATRVARYIHRDKSGALQAEYDLVNEFVIAEQFFRAAFRGNLGDDFPLELLPELLNDCRPKELTNGR